MEKEHARPGEPLKILIAEDDPVSRRILQNALERFGYEVVLATNGAEAWELFNREEIKFIISDWMMPLLDGVGLCRKIRLAKNTGYVYLILLTGKDSKEDIVEGLKAGADDYLTKPFDMEELRVRVRAGERILTLERELTEKHEALQNMNARLEELARIDPLTETGNRRSFYEAISKAHHRASRYMQGYGIVMCDLDNFKSYNDTYGHIEGDRILKIVADSVRKAIRISDELFRYGGEEFVVILHDQGLEGSVIFAERIRATVESLQREHMGSEKKIVTISCGVEAFLDSERDGEWDAVLTRADKALYRAKMLGKNRVETCPD